MKKTEFRDIVLKKIEETHEAFFQEIHEIAGTKSGDIAPEQVMELHGLTNKLVDLMVEQVMQNNPANISYPVVLENLGMAIQIENGYLTSTPIYKDGTYSKNDSDYCMIAKNVTDVDISFLDEVYDATGWIYIRDYKLGTVL